MEARELTESMAAAYAAYEKGDAEPFFGLIAEDGLTRHVAPPEAFRFAVPRRGPAGAREAVDLIREDYQWLTFRNLELIADGDTVFALNGGRLRHRASGREAAVNLADLVRFEEGRIAEFVEFFDTAGVHDWASGTGLPAYSLMNPGNKAIACEADEAARNKAMLAAAYTAYGQKDAGPLFGLLADDASYNSVAGLRDYRFAGPCHGRDAFIENVARIAEDYDLEKYEIRRMVAQGDLVAAHADVAFRYRKTDKVACSEKIDLFRLRDGRIIEFNEFFDTLTARACHAAG